MHWWRLRKTVNVWWPHTTLLKYPGFYCIVTLPLITFQPHLGLLNLKLSRNDWICQKMSQGSHYQTNLAIFPLVWNLTIYSAPLTKAAESFNSSPQKIFLFAVSFFPSCTYSCNDTLSLTTELIFLLLKTPNSTHRPQRLNLGLNYSVFQQNYFQNALYY